MFITHAQTAEELRLEVVSHLHQTIKRLEMQHKVARSAREKAKIAFVMNEFEMMLATWTDLSIIQREPKNKSRTL